MWRNDTFNDIIGMLCEGRLGKAISMTDNYILSHPGLFDTEPLRTLRADYSLMEEYWRRGYDDPDREQLYKRLLRQAYTVCADLALSDYIIHKPVLLSIVKRVSTAHADNSTASMRAKLEDFVSNAALLSLEPTDTKREKSFELYQQHQHSLHNMFDMVWTAHQWRETRADAFAELLLSPTVDVNDQRLLVSAVTLAAMNSFDFQKWRLLTIVYQNATDESLRQRALVGWVLATDGRMAALYPEMADVVSNLCNDEHCRQELCELQMQLVYCTSTEADSRRIRNEIMPDLLSHNNLKITPHGLEETEEDSLEEILHPDAAEQNLEKVEQSMQKMADMQRQGSDIYFSGFSQMKRFPFFDDLSNWFAPFYPQHPGISKIWNGTHAHNFLHTITQVGAFCDSDKYSFVLAFDQVLSHIPKNMLKMIEDGEATPMPVGGEMPLEEQQQPAFIRRMYLQNLYRFFRLYPMRSEFCNPFADVVFFNNPLLQATSLQQYYPKIAAFFVKRHLYAAAADVLKATDGEHQDYQYHMLFGQLALRNLASGSTTSASLHFREAVSMKPKSEKALAGLARALFGEQSYQEALEIYEQLIQLHPEHSVYELGHAVCLLSIGEIEKAQQELFRLSYNAPDNLQIKRSLAWALTLGDKLEQAEKHYQQLLETQSDDADLLNYGYCLWFQHRVEQASRLFRDYAEKRKDDASFHFEQEFQHNEQQLLNQHGISPAEVQLMLNLIS